MMRHGLQEIDWKYVGAALADVDAIKQAEFFSAFVKECKSWGTHFQIETQMLEIRDRLTPDERREIATIGWDGNE